MLLRSIVSTLYYETAILGRRDWMLLQAVHRYGSAIQKQRKQKWTQIRTIQKMRVSSVGQTCYKRIHRAPIRATQQICSSHNWTQTVFSPINSQLPLKQLTHSYYAPNRYHSFKDCQCKYWKTSQERRCRKLISMQQYMSNTHVLEVMQRAARVRQLLQLMEIPAADRQLLPLLQTIDALASGFQLQAQEFWELGLLTIYHILEDNLTEALIDTVSELVLALRQVEYANMARIKLLSGIITHLLD
ncbi:MAG: hypothetical protein EZS28_009562 [Streblomastix strix]|uniref:Uncharacterized protein n=1 Tax=Streblomastix strix TaxID=222440 RepID=A0A5J4WJ85_9EUKA|nr:MAG: hypothetical protein EZS28_009562 [Streblomastix strix]